MRNMSPVVNQPLSQQRAAKCLPHLTFDSKPSPQPITVHAVLHSWSLVAPCRLKDHANHPERINAAMASTTEDNIHVRYVPSFCIS